MIFHEPRPGPEEANLDTLVSAIKPYFKKGWENHVEEILLQMSYASNNHSFLNDFVHRQVKDNKWPKLYGAQSFLCYESREFFIRFNLWFPEKESAVAEQIKKFFSIGLLHNHNFPLLTVGLFGPGYRTGLFRWDDVEYDRKAGEKLGLDFSANLSLSLGSTLYLEKDKDFHTQHWPESFSISLNVIPTTANDYSPTQYIMNDDLSIYEALDLRDSPRGSGSPRATGDQREPLKKD